MLYFMVKIIELLLLILIIWGMYISKWEWWKKERNNWKG